MLFHFLTEDRDAVPLVINLSEVVAATIDPAHKDRVEVWTSGGSRVYVKMSFGMFVSKLQEAGLLEKED